MSIKIKFVLKKKSSNKVHVICCKEKESTAPINNADKAP